MSASRLLVRGVNWLGDAVMSTPALQRLREARPAARITLLTRRAQRDLWAHHPSIDEVLTFEQGESPWSVARRLRAGNFDAALVLPNSPRAALEVWRAGIPERIGYARAWRNWFLTQAVPPRPGRVEMRKLSPKQVNAAVAAENAGADYLEKIPRAPSVHQMNEYLHLAATLGAKPEPLAPKLVVTDVELREAEQKWIAPLRREKRIAADEPTTLLGLNPGAEYGPAKRWPAENFAAAASKVSRQRKNCLWIIFGGASDHELGDCISRLTEGAAVNLAGRTTLREFMALLKLCRVVLTNDTGPMHVAAALGTPVVVPFGSTSPELTGPGLPGDPRHHLLQGRAPCSPCFRRECPIDFRCMKSITIERVADAVLEALRQPC